MKHTMKNILIKNKTRKLLFFLLITMTLSALILSSCTNNPKSTKEIVCGNNLCESTENRQNCPQDCLKPRNTNNETEIKTNTSINTSTEIIDTKEKIPIIDMPKGTYYMGKEGGLYAGWTNEPGEYTRQKILEAISEIKPLDKNGNPSSNGKIGFMSIGMSNTNINFGAFQSQALSDPQVNDDVMIINTAHFGFEAEKWATTDEPWTNAKTVIEKAGATPEQMQIAWMYIAIGRVSGDFPDSAIELEEYSKTIMQRLKQEYPNIKIVYISSRTYAGWATIRKNPEPYAYEAGFAMKWLIQEQIDGSSELNYDPSKGPVKAPLLMWGPYLWADGEHPNSQGLFYIRSDFTEDDGTHPSDQGAKKIGAFMLNWFKTNELSKSWFLN